MKILKQFKRNFLIRLMSALGFGGMTAFCLASCQPAVNDVQQPKQETSNITAPEAAQPVVPEAAETPEPAKEQAPEPVANPAVPNAEPPADTLPAPELPTDAANPNDNAEFKDLKPELTEDDSDSETIPGPVVAPIETKYGIRNPPPKYGPRPVKKYGIVKPPPRDTIPVKKYGVML